MKDIRIFPYKNPDYAIIEVDGPTIFPQEQDIIRRNLNLTIEHSKGPIILDLTKVVRASSTGILRPLEEAYEACQPQQRTIALIGIQSEVEKLFNYVNVDSVRFPRFKTLDEAIKNLNNNSPL